MSAQQQPVKVTLQSQRAGDSAKHNDRTMYRNGYFNELAPQDGLTNYHWSQETFGIGSEAREREVYEALFSEKVVRTNESKKKHYRKDVYDLDDPKQREKALEEYRWKHPPRETIFQIGSMDNPISRQQAKGILRYQGERLEEMDSENFVLLSYDIHMDEGSPHMHARYLLLDEKGEVNTEGGLRALGVEPPVPYDKWAKEQNEKRAKRAEKNGKQYKTVKPKSSTNNNRLMTFTKNMRESFEELVEEYGISINTHRTRKKHLTIRAEKAEHKRLQAMRDRSDVLDEAERRRAHEERKKKETVEKAQQEQEKIRGEIAKEKQMHAEIMDEQRAELTRLRDENMQREDEMQRDIDSLKEEASQGQEYLRLSDEYSIARNEAIDTANKVKENVKYRSYLPPLTIGDQEVNEEWFERMSKQAEIAPFQEHRQRKEILDDINTLNAKWREYTGQTRENRKNPLLNKDKEQKEEFRRKVIGDPEKTKKTADQQKQKYIETTKQNNGIRNRKKPAKFAPPTQQAQEEKDDGFEFDF